MCRLVFLGDRQGSADGSVLYLYRAVGSQPRVQFPHQARPHGLQAQRRERRPPQGQRLHERAQAAVRQVEHIRGSRDQTAGRVRGRASPPPESHQETLLRVHRQGDGVQQEVRAVRQPQEPGTFYYKPS
uniref:(California timema) hypothetical protein n=1 Tax=Timema californicum TaxID=61474 RepID=A0A7R9PFT7_TIMCA|nr:unnamed protein product [Timema californicum]